MEGWKLYIPASPTGKRRAYNASFLGTKEEIYQTILDKSLHNLAKKQGVWTPMTTEEIAAKTVEIEEDLDRF